MNQKETQRSPLFIIYFGVGILILGLLAWSSMRMLRETPEREVNLELPGTGWVNLRLTTDPFPPLPSGTVILTLVGMNSQGLVLKLGESVPYTFSLQGSETNLGSGLATPSQDGSGYRASVQFPAPGQYDVNFDLGGGAVARYQLYVEPAQ